MQLGHWAEASVPLFFLVIDEQSFSFYDILFGTAGALILLNWVPCFRGCFHPGEFGVFAFLGTTGMRHYSRHDTWSGLLLAGFVLCLVHPVLLVLLLPFLPFRQLVALLLADRRLLLLWPGELFLIGLFSLSVSQTGSASSPLHSLSTNTIRKVYHLATPLLFLPALHLNPGLLRVAFGFAFLLGLAVERLRVLRVLQSRQLDAFMQRCRNERDRGEMVLSHLYLLLGCALPVWLSDDRQSRAAGIISLGLGDSVASLVGRRWGRHRLGHSRKTVEGTVAGAVAMFLSFLGTGMSVVGAAVVAIGAALWESVTELNDNLSLPLVTMYLIRMTSWA